MVKVLTCSKGKKKCTFITCNPIVGRPHVPTRHHRLGPGKSKRMTLYPHHKCQCLVQFQRIRHRATVREVALTCTRCPEALPKDMMIKKNLPNHPKKKKKPHISSHAPLKLERQLLSANGTNSADIKGPLPNYLRPHT
jgi:hypothetical protein